MKRRLIALLLTAASFIGLVATPAFAFSLNCYSHDCVPGGAYTTYRLMFKCNDAGGATYTNQVNDSIHDNSTLVVQLWYKANDADSWHFWTAAAADLALYDGQAVSGYSGDKQGMHYAAYVYWQYTATGVVWGNGGFDTFAGTNGTC